MIWAFAAAVNLGLERNPSGQDAGWVGGWVGGRVNKKEEVKAASATTACDLGVLGKFCAAWMSNKIGANSCALRHSLNLSRRIDAEQDRGKLSLHHS